MAATTTVAAFTRNARHAKPSSICRVSGDHTGTDRLPCCGGEWLRKLGETVTRRWKDPAPMEVIKHVREKHLPGLREDQTVLTMISCEEFGQHHNRSIANPKAPRGKTCR